MVNVFYFVYKVFWLSKVSPQLMGFLFSGNVFYTILCHLQLPSRDLGVVFLVIVWLNPVFYLFELIFNEIRFLREDIYLIQEKGLVFFLCRHSV